jgi:predicted ribosomally synthesized peptide with nif11-like leader
MAFENAKKFLEQAMKDKALRARTAEKEPVEIVAIAKELGFDVTAEELM